MEHRPSAIPAPGNSGHYFPLEVKARDLTGSVDVIVFVEPVDFLEAATHEALIGPHEFQAIAYILRHRRKGQREDIEKAIWWLERYLKSGDI
jgi:hypothetical protein